MVGHRSGFLDGVDTRLQIRNQDLALGIGGTVKVVASILDFGNAEGDASQPGAVGAELNQLEGRLDGVGKDELGVLVGIKLDNALGFIDDVAGAGLLRYHIGSSGQVGQVDLAVFIGGKLLRAIVTRHRLDLKDRIGDHLGRIGRIHLNEPHAGFHIIKEGQLFDAVTGLQFHRLGGGVQDIAIIAGIHLNGPVGSGFQIGQQNFTKCVRLEFTQAYFVTEYLEGHSGHGQIVFAVVLDNA